MEVLDAQVHLNHIHPEWKTAQIDDILAAALAAMDAVGVDGLVVSEFWGFDGRWREELSNGVFRSQYPFSELAASKEPRRFIYHTMVSVDDPQLDEQVARVRQQPGGVALRIVPIPETGAVARLEKGEFEPLFAAAERHSVPVFCWLPGRGHLLVPYLNKFPRLQFILDHCGVGQAPYRFGPTAPTLLSSLVQTRAERVAQFDEVVELAQYSNLALKWCHAPQWRQPIGSNLPGRSGRGGRSQDLGHCYGEQRMGKLRRAEGQHVAVLVIAVVILLAKVTLGVAFGSAWGASHGARTVVHRSRP